MAETVGDRDERLERKPRKVEAEVADLRVRQSSLEWSENIAMRQPFFHGLVHVSRRLRSRDDFLNEGCSP